ncbi:MAG: 6-phosphogluconolactonase [Oscillospiraceae bacterium]|nr:6-phosphogluconolactonase [Oscillospiraceae bacterium]
MAAKPDAVLALAAGQTMPPLWARLREMNAAGELSFRQARILLVGELLGVAEDKNCRCALENGLLRQTDVDPGNCFFPDGDDPAAYDTLIEQLGGIDLAVLGIGFDCHIGYNEPGTLFDTSCHVQKLTDRTKRQLLQRGFTDADMPDYAVTMGIKTLTDARDILLLAYGEEKAAAVYEMLYAKTMPFIPAAFLQIPLEVTVVVDTAAGSRL